MGTALAVMRSTAEPEKKRRQALGPSERAAPRSALQRIVGHARVRARLHSEEGFREVLAEAFSGVVTFGGTTAAEVYHAFQRGDHVAAVALLVKAGADLTHATELMEHWAALEEIAEVEVASGAGVVIGALSIAVVGMEMQLHAMLAMCEAHAGGDRDAAALKYASVWSRMLTAFLYGDVTLPDSELLPHLKEARSQAVHDAFATMSKLRGERAGLADQLRQELGTPSNARRALMDTLLERSGFNGLCNHSAVVR